MRVLRKLSIFLLLTIWMSILFSVGVTYLGPQMAESLTPAETQFAGLALLVVCAVDTLLLGLFIVYARSYGWRLMVITALLYYGVKSFQANIEAVYFMVNITPEIAPRLFLMWLPITLAWPPVAVWLLGKACRSTTEPPLAGPLPPMTTWRWIGKLALLGVVVYPLLFWGFGYYVAWQVPEVRAFYHGTDPGSFLLQMRNLVSGDPLVIPFEWFRGLLWAGMAALFLWTMQDRPWLAALLLTLLFALLENDVHLLPNVLMPTIVRQTHFIETASSNFIFGLLAAALLLWSPPGNRPHGRLTPAADQS